MGAARESTVFKSSEKIRVITDGSDVAFRKNNNSRERERESRSKDASRFSINKGLEKKVVQKSDGKKKEKKFMQISVITFKSSQKPS